MNLPVIFEPSADAPIPLPLSDLQAVRVAQRAWARVPVRDRLGKVRRFRQSLAGSAGSIARSSAATRQRPVAEVITAEVLPLLDACRFLERRAENLLAPRSFGRRGLPLWLFGVRSALQREPYGVVLIIGPGNYPLLLPGVQMLQALVAGNAVLLKPGVGGTPAARALVELTIAAGFDPQLILLLQESVASATAAIAARPDKVLFTGSADTGEKILTQLAPRLIPSTMELSGSDCVLVCADADLALVSRALVFGLRLNNGATCMAPKRVYVAACAATELEGRLAELLQNNRVISPPPPSLVRRLDPLLNEVLDGGAHFVAGTRDERGLHLPIVLAGVPPQASLLKEDVFAPVLSLITVASDEDAVAQANDCPYALGASVFTRDAKAAQRIARELHVGLVSINDLIIPSADPRLPFGGRRRSGFGVTRGVEGLLELTVPKVVTTTTGTTRPAYDPLQPGDTELFQNYCQLTYGSGLKERTRAFWKLASRIARRR